MANKSASKQSSRLHTGIKETVNITIIHPSLRTRLSQYKHWMLFYPHLSWISIILQVCELDIIFNFEKAYFMLDELLLGGEVQETSKKNVLKAIAAQDLLQEVRSTLIGRLHGKGSLMDWVVVIPKEGRAPALLLVWHRLFRWSFFLKRFFFFEKSVSYQKEGGVGHACPSFFWYDTDSGHWGPFCVTQPILYEIFLSHACFHCFKYI